MTTPWDGGPVSGPPLDATTHLMSTLHDVAATWEQLAEAGRPLSCDQDCEALLTGLGQILSAYQLLLVALEAGEEGTP